MIQSGTWYSGGTSALGCSAIKGHTAAAAATMAATPTSAPAHRPAMTRAQAPTTKRAAKLRASFRARLTAHKYHPGAECGMRQYGPMVGWRADMTRSADHKLCW